MLGQAIENFSEEPVSLPLELTAALTVPEANSTANIAPTPTKTTLRKSLTASTLDAVFATIFTNIAGGVLLSNFLVELKASPLEIGFLSSIPMLANLLQPIGAFLSNRVNSRFWYGLWVYAPSRLLWLVLVIGILLLGHKAENCHLLILLSLLSMVMTHFSGALGSASWLSWMAALVPRRLRGRYFGFRNSAASLTSLVSLPLIGWGISCYPGGSIKGYGLMLLVGILAGLISIGCQFFMADINPQQQHLELPASTIPSPAVPVATEPSPPGFLWKDANFMVFLLYFGIWMFAVNLSAPFFNIYLLDNLHLEVTWVTLYTSLGAGANLLLMVIWGQLADRIGNRPILMLVGILVAITPLLWLGVGSDPASLWLWLPLLHILAGGTWAAIDLCNNNIQLEVFPTRYQSTYFACAAAVAGVSGALGTTTGGFLAQFADYGGLPGLFALSSVLRLIALLPLILVNEQRGHSITQVVQRIVQFCRLPAVQKLQFVPIRVFILENVSKFKA